MKRIMKQLAVCVLATIDMTANAQTLKSAFLDIEDIDGVLLSSEHKQGRDQLDSLYSFQEETFVLPYKSKKDKKVANDNIRDIVEGYRNEVGDANGAFAFNADLETEAAAASMISIFY